MSRKQKTGNHIPQTAVSEDVGSGHGLSALSAVFVGAGNVATHLSAAMRAAGNTTVQVYSRTAESAQTLAARLQAEWTTDLKKLVPDAGLYVFSLPDDALAEAIVRVRPNGALWIHTAGSVSIDVFGHHVHRCGVLYPLQTFSRKREVDFSRIPCFVEARLPADELLLCKIAGQISGDVRVATSEKRKYLHLAAVYACNFTAHMYALAAKILERQDIPWQTLLPLIDETAAKIHALTPAQAQTGPAVRNDRKVMHMHEDMLADTDMKRIYQLISNHIYKESTHE